MRSPLLLLLLLFVAFCSRRKGANIGQTKGFVITNDFAVEGDTVNYEIKNFAESSYFYLILREDKFSYTPAFKNRNFSGVAYNRIISHIYKGRDSLEVNQIIVSTSPFFIEDDDEKEYNLYIDSLKREIYRTTTLQRILISEEFLKIKTILRNYEKNEITGDEYRIIPNSAGNYTLQLSYTSDSTFVKQTISKGLLDSLRRNNIKIFHGTIYSNKVPLKFEY